MLSEREKFSRNKKYFLAKKSSFDIKNISFVLRYVLNSSQKVSCRRDKKIFLSEFIFLALRKIFLYVLDLRTHFSNQENISQ